MFADQIKNAIFGYFHEFKLSMDPASDPEVLDIEPDEPAKRLIKPQSRVWCFDREWECAMFDDARKLADFVVKQDIKSKMPATLKINYLVVLFRVHISNTGIPYAQMNGYIQSSKQLNACALRQWFPEVEEEGRNLSVVKGGLCGNSSYEFDMKKTSPWMTYTVIGELRLNNSGKRQVIQ